MPGRLRCSAGCQAWHFDIPAESGPPGSPPDHPEHHLLRWRQSLFHHLLRGLIWVSGLTLLCSRVIPATWGRLGFHLVALLAQKVQWPRFEGLKWMPFKSRKQERYLQINEPDIYEDWVEEYGHFKGAEAFSADFAGMKYELLVENL